MPKYYEAIYIPILASLGALLMGYEIGIIGSALLFIKPQFALDAWTAGTIGSMVIPGTMIGVLIITFAIDKYNRQQHIFFSGLIFTLSLFILALTHQTFLLIVGRLLTGIAIGIILVVVPLYLAEIASPRSRGKYIATFQLSITFGVLLGYYVSYLFAQHAAWRWMFASGLIFAILQIISSRFLPASHYEFDKSNQSKTSSKHMFNKKFHRVLLVGNGLSILQQLTGINAIAFYAPQIFKDAHNVSDVTAIFSGFILMIANFVFTVISLFVFDYVGRRPILLVSVAIQWLSLAALSFVNFSSHSILVLIILVFYISSFAFGLGPGMWLIVSEIFPMEIRNKAMGMTIFINNIIAFIVVATFLPLINMWGKPLIFGFYSIISFLGLLFIYFFIPETTGKTLEEITQ